LIFRYLENLGTKLCALSHDFALCSLVDDRLLTRWCDLKVVRVDTELRKKFWELNLLKYRRRQLGTTALLLVHFGSHLILKVQYHFLKRLSSLSNYTAEL